jgi:arsenate reductase
VMGEVLLNALGDGHFRGYSAGSNPKGQVHKMTLEVLREAGLPTDGLRSKSWDEFAVEGAPHMDFVFTVCDNAAGESCPFWPGHPMSAHWGIEDPAAVEGPDFRQRAAFEEALGFMRDRILAFVALPFTTIDAMTLDSRLKSLGQMAGSSTLAAGAA